MTPSSINGPQAEGSSTDRGREFFKSRGSWISSWDYQFLGMTMDEAMRNPLFVQHGKKKKLSPALPRMYARNLQGGGFDLPTTSLTRQPTNYYDNSTESYSPAQVLFRDRMQDTSALLFGKMRQRLTPGRSD